MNDDRRIQISVVNDMLDKCKSHIDKISNILQKLCEEEDDARSRIPENLENSSRYLMSEEASDQMSDALDALYSANEYINTAIKKLEEI